MWHFKSFEIISCESFCYLNPGRAGLTPSTYIFFFNRYRTKDWKGHALVKVPSSGSEESRTSYKFFILVLFSPEPSVSAHILIPKKYDKFCFFFLLALDIWKNLFMVRSEFIFCHQKLMWVRDWPWEVSVKRSFLRPSIFWLYGSL